MTDPYSGNWGRIVRPGGNGMPRPMGSGLAGRMVRPMGRVRKSDYITTRCYSPTGVQLWEGDHGNTVFALAVGSNGTVYQAGAESSTANIGDSLFHKYADSEQPLITAMTFGGRPVWSINAAAGSGYSDGIAVTSGYVYCGVNAPTPYLAKLDAGNGTDVLHLPVAGFIRSFNAEPSTTPPFVSGVAEPEWGRVRVDGSGNVYAIGTTSGNVTQSVYKWVSDEEFWLFDEQAAAYYAATGLGVSASGLIATASRPASVGGAAINTPLFYLTRGDADNLTVAAFSGYTAKATKPYFGQTGYPPAGVGGYNQTGISPDGTLAITYDDMNDAIVSVSVGGTPDSPSVAALTSLAALGGSVFRRYTAMAINDSGTYCYSIPRGTLTPDGTHDIRSGGSLVARLDHGGAIYDAAVLPDGRVIVAGERVLRADFP